MARMWTYLTKNFRRADVEFPKGGKRHNNEEAFSKGFDADIKPLISTRKDIVAFDTIFGYGGTGHVDVFDGMTFSNAPDWYPSQRVMLWYIEVPPKENA